MQEFDYIPKKASIKKNMFYKKDTMNHTRVILLAGLLMSSALLISESNQERLEMISLDEDIESLLNESSYDADYTQAPTLEKVTLSEQLKIKCRRLGIGILCYIANMRIWFDQTNSRVRSWLNNA